MIRAVVVGAAGYTGGELLRLLRHHPAVNELVAVSESHAGLSLSTAHSDLFELKAQTFVKSFSPQSSDVIFLCGAHGESSKLLQKHGIEPGLQRVIDLSQDFRPRGSHPSFVYGLSEAFRGEIQEAKAIANPGCFATAIQLALYPLAKAQKLSDSVHITGITGSTGAGQKLQETSHYSWRQGNLSVYKAFEHQHLNEIKETLTHLQPGYAGDLAFIPMRGAFTRGILCSLHTRIDESFETLQSLYLQAYEHSPFVHVMAPEIHLKQVVNTNHTLISLEKHGAYLHLVVCLDNLIKGASGQAVQNMNLLLGRPETDGLLLKPLVH